MHGFKTVLGVIVGIAVGSLIMSNCMTGGRRNQPVDSARLALKEPTLRPFNVNSPYTVTHVQWIKEVSLWRVIVQPLHKNGSVSAYSTKEKKAGEQVRLVELTHFNLSNEGGAYSRTNFVRE